MAVMTVKEAEKLLAANPVWRVTKPMVVTIGAMTYTRQVGELISDGPTLIQLLTTGYDGIMPAQGTKYVECPNCRTVIPVAEDKPNAAERRRQEQSAKTPRVSGAGAISR